MNIKSAVNVHNNGDRNEEYFDINQQKMISATLQPMSTYYSINIRASCQDFCIFNIHFHYFITQVIVNMRTAIFMLFQGYLASFMVPIWLLLHFFRH